MRKLVWSAVLIVAIAAVATAAARNIRPTQAEASNPNAQVVRVTRRDIGTIVKATGVIKPRVGAEVKVGSRISGVVDHLYVQIGDAVSKGQLLAALDDRDLLARRDEAAATLRQAEADWQYLVADLRRKSALGASGNIAAAELELAASGVEVAKQKVEGARASLAFAAAQAGYARIVAPIGGVVASVSTQEGETVAASFAAPTFLTLLDPSRLEVWAYVDETDIGRIRSGQTARFTVDTYGDHEFDGRVTTVYPKAEIRDNVVNYVTVVRFEPPRDRTLRSEMTTTVRIALEMREHALAVPIRAVRWQDKRAFVFTPKGERRWVTTGMKDDTHVEITSGLREGDEVLIGEPTPKGERDS